MGNTEIFELCETSSKRQCPDCAFYWEVGIENCTCGKCMQPAEQNRQMNKDRFDALSILGYLMKKDQSRGARHGQSIRQIMYYKSTRYDEESPKQKEWIVQQLILKDGPGMNDIARICQNLDGLKNKFDNMTHLHWKIIPTCRHLKNEAHIGSPGRSL